MEVVEVDHALGGDTVRLGSQFELGNDPRPGETAKQSAEVSRIADTTTYDSRGFNPPVARTGSSICLDPVAASNPQDGG